MVKYKDKDNCAQQKPVQTIKRKKIDTNTNTTYNIHGKKQKQSYRAQQRPGCPSQGANSQKKKDRDKLNTNTTYMVKKQ